MISTTHHHGKVINEHMKKCIAEHADMRMHNLGLCQGCANPGWTSSVSEQSLKNGSDGMTGASVIRECLVHPFLEDPNSVLLFSS